jgi:hypothetical protein
MPLRFILIFVAMSLMLSCRQSLKKQEKPQIESFENARAFAEKYLPKEGILVQENDGYAYVKVDDRYINDLFPLLNLPGFQKPPYFRRKNAPGAHISVAYKDEHVRFKEVGQTFSFRLNNISEVLVKPATYYIVFQLIAPDLERLRLRYGLKAKLMNHEFHISLAKKLAN